VLANLPALTASYHLLCRLNPSAKSLCTCTWTYRLHVFIILSTVFNVECRGSGFAELFCAGMSLEKEMPTCQQGRLDPPGLGNIPHAAAELIQHAG
jgi:hypothetical protein